MRDVSHLDPINVGTLAAACSLCDDHHVSFRLDNTPASLTGTHGSRSTFFVK